MRLLGCLGGLLAACTSAPALAQVAFEAALQSDYRLRGYSLSDGEPVASVTASYDDPSGFYLAATTIGMVREGDPELLSLQGNIGYAVRISPRASVDAGVLHAQYFSGYGSGYNYDYTEIYAGVATPNVAARVRYSPNYFRNDAETIYAEVDGGIEVAPDWLLSAHAGVLHYLDSPPLYLSRTRFDWRIGASRQIGGLGLHLDVTGRLADQETYAFPLPGAFVRARANKTAVVASATYAF